MTPGSTTHTDPARATTRGTRRSNLVAATAMGAALVLLALGLRGASIAGAADGASPGADPSAPAAAYTNPVLGGNFADPGTRADRLPSRTLRARLRHLRVFDRALSVAQTRALQRQ